MTAAAPWAEPFFTFGVTGTNGKTSTCRLLSSILREDSRSVLEITTLGVRHDGRILARGKGFTDFLATLEAVAREGCRHAVVEATSHGLSRGYARAWRFDLGVFTNLSPDHLNRHKTWEHYLASKAQLFIHLGPGCHAIFNAGDPHSVFLDRATPSDVVRRWFWAPHRGECLHPSELAASSIELSPLGTTIELEPSMLADALGGRLETQLIGEVFAENTLAAALAALASGIPASSVRSGIAACPPVPGRFEVVDHGPGKPIVAVDYAHSTDALVHTCRTARRLAADEGRLIVVFGAGGGATPEKRRPMGKVVGEAADLAFVTNDNPRDEDPVAIAQMLVDGLREGDRAKWHTELDRRTAIEAAIDGAGAGDVVVIAGKGHEEGQTIGGTVVAFSDSEVAAACCARRRVSVAEASKC